jgi:RsiW-degrading membrane proteinase PrsW (M82 family)
MKLGLNVNDGTLAGRTFELETGFIWIGRGENCTVRLDPTTERIASKQHAFIEAKPDGYYITDNNSTNGTLVNGTRVSTARLNDGDTIQFGRNGVTASVNISLEPAAQRPDVSDFRQIQIDSFQSAAASVPTGFQNSIANIGLGHVEVAPAPSRVGAYIAIALALGAMIPLGIFVMAIIYLSIGPYPALLATLIAFTPAALYAFPLLWLDRFDPEPPWLITLAFAWGAFVAVLVSLIVNTAFGILVYAGTGVPQLADIAGAVISAPIIEEASKGVGLLILLIAFRKHFDDMLDGIVFGGVIALGFATVENVLYYGDGLARAYQEYGWTSSALWSFLFLFMLRGILSPWAHVLFTAMTGIGCGLARESHNWFVRLLMPLLGYIAAVVLHGIWNGMGIVITLIILWGGFEPACSSIGLGGEYVSLCGFFTLYILFEIPIFLLFLGFAFFIMRRQRRILSEMLAIDIARGLITEDDLKRSGSFLKSSAWLLGGLFSGKYIARYRFSRAIAKLGLSYWHIQRATAAQGQTASFQQNPLFRDEVLRWRDKV